MGAAPPWGQSLLRSCLAAHSFPPPPPLNRVRCLPLLGNCMADLSSALGTVTATDGSERIVGWAHHAQPLSGGGGGKECAARHERSNDWPQGGAAPITRTRRQLPFWVVQRFALRLLATAVAVLLASYLFPNLIIVESPARAVVFAIVLGI